RAVVGRQEPGPVGIPFARAHLVHRAAFPLAEGQLAQLLERHERDAGAGQCDLGGLARAPERAHVRGGQAIAAEGGAESLGLRASTRGQRDVGASLETAFGVPDGFAVAREQQPHVSAAPGDAGRSWWLAVASRAARRRASVSSRPSNARTWKSG